MIVQENPTNKQRFINLPSELCKVFDIEQGTNIEFKIVTKNQLMMIITR